MRNLLWNIYAVFYDKGVNTLPIYDDMLNSVVEKIALGKSDVLLDLGAGTGNLEAKLVANGYHCKEMILLDGSEFMLDRAVNKDFSQKQKVNIIDQDLNTLPFPLDDGSVDKVVMVNSLYVVDSPEQVLNEVYRVLKKDGKLIIANPYDKEGFKKMKRAVYEGLSVWRAILLTVKLFPVILINKMIATKAKDGQYSFLEVKDMNTLLSKTGFDSIENPQYVYADTTLLFVTQKTP